MLHGLEMPLDRAGDDRAPGELSFDHCITEGLSQRRRHQNVSAIQRWPDRRLIADEGHRSPQVLVLRAGAQLGEVLLMSGARGPTELEPYVAALRLQQRDGFDRHVGRLPRREPPDHEQPERTCGPAGRRSRRRTADAVVDEAEPAPEVRRRIGRHVEGCRAVDDRRVGERQRRRERPPHQAVVAGLGLMDMADAGQTRRASHEQPPRQRDRVDVDQLGPHAPDQPAHPGHRRGRAAGQRGQSARGHIRPSQDGERQELDLGPEGGQPLDQRPRRGHRHDHPPAVVAQRDDAFEQLEVGAVHVGRRIGHQNCALHLHGNPHR